VPEADADPRAEYSRRLENRAETVAAKERLHFRAGNAKLAVVAAGLAMAWMALGRSLFPAYWLVVPAAMYAALVVYHERVLRVRARANLAAEFYRRGMGRMNDRWSGTGESGERFRDPKHPYADDLDIFGTGCLFELLCTARMPMGQNRLAQWLSAAPPVAEIIGRQESVAELREKLDLREHLAVAGETLRSRFDPEALITWAENSAGWPGNPRALSALRLMAAFFAMAALVALGDFLATRNFWPLVIVLIPEAIFRQWLQKRAKEISSGVACNADGLALFAKILERLEKERFQSAKLNALAPTLQGSPLPVSMPVRRLARIVYWIDARGGMLGNLLDLPLLYTAQTGLAAEAWRRKWGGRVRGWIDAAAEMEALLSLAGYSYEHPDDPFPKFLNAGDFAGDDSARHCTALFDGQELGHPLIASRLCIRNSVQLDKHTQLLLVSGSNMSGKSTLLRTVGINAVLAVAGAPIRGTSLRMTLLTVGTRIRSADSLQEGRSNFYTEILRIREVVTLAKEKPPVLFLFDELLEGTNSADRLIGAEALIGGLLKHGAVGIVTTHDLALTEIGAAGTTPLHGSLPGALQAALRNLHFQDYMEGGIMRFDYKLREGIVEKSNAVELMRLIGWEV
jgi:hypothetical protein